MDNRKTYTTEAICLRAMDYGEADRILHLYTPEGGRISAFAKGAKRAKSKLAPACERLNLCEVQLASGRTMETVCQAQSRQSFLGLRQDVLKLSYGMLFADLVAATEAANADSHEIFLLLRDSLETLAVAPEEEAMGIGLFFQRAWLDVAGFHPVLDVCILSGERLDPEALYYCFSAELGGLSMPQTRQQWRVGATRQENSLEWVNVSATTIALLDCPRDPRWTDAQRGKAQKFLRYYFAKVLEKDIQAYHFLFQLLDLPDRATAPLSAATASFQ
jgi:DNA repair protein RecO (recombination protein O)